jgi:RNA polymerase sigma-70 factor, ECF subfamily
LTASRVQAAPRIDAGSHSFAPIVFAGARMNGNAIARLRSAGARNVMAQPQDATLEPDDDVLVARSRQGDMNAFSELVVRYQDLVFRVVRRMSRMDAATAEDLAQETFLRAFRGLPQFRGECRFVHWLLRIAHNAVINRGTSMSTRFSRQVRSLDAPRPGREDDGSHDPHDVKAPAPSEALENSEMKGVLERALAEMPDDFRSAVVLCDVEGLEYEEIAQILSVPVGTVRSRIHRGREALKEIITRLMNRAPVHLRLEGGGA